jgi:hypothetical protein
MLDTPIDATYVWLGLAVASAAALGLALRLPAAPAPDAAGVADTVDSAAASPHGSTAAHPVAADAVKVRPRRLSLRSERGVARAALDFGPVTPTGDGRLDAVLHGTPPGAAFESSSGLCRAADRARDADPAWQPVEDRVLVRHVTWEGCDVTLVGA